MTNKNKEWEAQAREVVLQSSKKDKVLCDTFIYEPENVVEKPLGNLYMAGEVANVDNRSSLFVVNLVASVVKKEYYRLPKRGVLKSFEAALHKANSALADFTAQGDVGWLGKLSMAIAVLENDTLHVTKSGGARVLFEREGRIIDITKDLNQESKEVEKHPLKTFTNVASGQVAFSDRVVLATAGTFGIMSIANLGRLVGGKIDDAISQIQLLMESLENKEEYSGLIVIGLDERKKEEEKKSLEGTIERGKEITLEELLHEANEKKLKEERAQDRLNKINEKGIKKGATWMKMGAEGGAKGIKKIGVWSQMKALPWLKIKGKDLKDWTVSKVKDFKKIKEGDVSEADVQESHEEILEREEKKATMGLAKESVLKKNKLSFKNFFPVIKEKVLVFFRIVMKAPLTYKMVALAVLILLAVLIGGLVVRKDQKLKEETSQQLQEKSLEIEEKLGKVEVNIIYKDKEKANIALNEATLLVEELKALEVSKNQIEEKDQKVGEFEKIISESLDKVGNVSRVTPELWIDLNKQTSQGFISWQDGVYVFDNGSFSKINFPQKTQEDVSEKDNETLSQMKDKGALLKMRTYGNYAYSLDNANDQILRFAKTNDGFSDGTDWIKPQETMDFSGVVSFAIDGSLYAVTQSGEITRYLKGYKKETTKINDTEVNMVSRIFIDEDIESFYILEETKNKLLIVDKKGEIQKQYLFEGIGQIKDTWVDKNTQEVYVLAEGKIYKVE